MTSGGDIAQYMTAAKSQSVTEFLLHMIPENAAAAFASGDILQVVDQSSPHI